MASRDLEAMESREKGTSEPVLNRFRKRHKDSKIPLLNRIRIRPQIRRRAAALKFCAPLFTTIWPVFTTGSCCPRGFSPSAQGGCISPPGAARRFPPRRPGRPVLRTAPAAGVSRRSGRTPAARKIVPPESAAAPKFRWFCFPPPSCRLPVNVVY